MEIFYKVMLISEKLSDVTKEPKNKR